MGKGIIWGIARGKVVINIAIISVAIGGVLLVPKLEVDAGLLSVSILMKNGMRVNFEGEKADIHKKV